MNTIFRGLVTQLSVFGSGGEGSAEIQVRVDEGKTLVVGADIGTRAFSGMVMLLATAFGTRQKVEVTVEDRGSASPKVICVNLVHTPKKR